MRCLSGVSYTSGEPAACRKSTDVKSGLALDPRAGERRSQFPLRVEVRICSLKLNRTLGRERVRLRGQVGELEAAPSLMIELGSTVPTLLFFWEPGSLHHPQGRSNPMFKASLALCSPHPPDLCPRRPRGKA